MDRGLFDGRGGSARRGLATIAYLKARFDAGMDHLGMFQPFVEDAIRVADADGIELSVVQRLVREATGLSIPTDVVKTLLRRAAKRGLLTRSGGRYFRSEAHGEDTDLRERIKELERAHQGLATHLREFAEERGEELGTDEDALAALTKFLDVNHMGMVLGQTPETGRWETASQSDRTVAAFVTKVVEEDGPSYAVLESVVQGLIVQNALLLRDIPTTKRHLAGLNVFLDTGVLLRALGYAGLVEQQVALESLNLIRAAGARLLAFERTVNEVETILGVYEHNLGSRTGMRSLYATALTYHFLSVKATPADIRQEIALLRDSLARLGIRIRDFPLHVSKYTEDEQALADILKDPTRNPDSDDARVWHDVEAIAAVVTLRAGKRPKRVESATYVFVSGSSQTVSNAERWYRETYPSGVEPIVHFQSLANTAWLVRSADGSNVPMHELVAICQAVLRPSTEVWSRFVAGLGELVSSGDVSDDESIAVLASEFTHVRLADLEPGADMEASTIREIVERVRAEQETELRSELDEERRKREESEGKVAVAKGHTATIVSSVEARLEWCAGFAAWTVYGSLCVVLILGGIWTLPTEWSEWTRANKAWALVWWFCVLAFMVCSLGALFTRRLQVLNVFDPLKRWFSQHLRRWLLPSLEATKRRD